MAFIRNKDEGKTYLPGYFLDREDCVRKTTEIPATLATTAADGSKYVPCGTIFPSNDGNAIGIVYEDVDVSAGNMPGSVVYAGYVIEGRLPVALDASAKTALQSKGFVFVTEPAVTRPGDGNL
ncbi:MAG: hypothetical protein IKX20_11185 [Paludibacteraceae bacterium]|nr:hypothetical protein [Paludibacteraceae bacterium]